MNRVPELKKNEEVGRTVKIHLNGKLEMDSNSVDYNLCGSVIYRDFVEHVEHVRIEDTHILTLPPDTVVSLEVVMATNNREECVRLLKSSPTHNSMHIKKIEVVHTHKVTLIP